jgi:hypothetical protein
MKYAAPYHDTLDRSRNSSVILGMAVLRMVLCNNARQCLEMCYGSCGGATTHIVERDEEHA